MTSIKIMHIRPLYVNVIINEYYTSQLSWLYMHELTITTRSVINPIIRVLLLDLREKEREYL